MIKFTNSRLFLLLLTANTPAFAQSTISNGSFEDATDCPSNIGNIELANDWIKNGETPDLFSRCAKPKHLGVPENYMGNTNAQDGSSYAGIFLFLKQPNENHISKFDYLRTEEIINKLTLDTKAGYLYEFTYWYALADSSNYFSNTMTLTLSKSPYDAYEYNSKSQIVIISITNPLTKSWACAKVRFASSENWKFVTIGYSRKMFSVNDYKYSLRKNKTNVNTKYSNKSCYYYLDNFSLIRVSKN